jgi:hypothetical protein
MRYKMDQEKKLAVQPEIPEAKKKARRSVDGGCKNGGVSF